MADQPARPLIAAVEPDGVPLPQRYWAILTIALGLTLAVLDGAIANVALPTIGRDIGASPAASIWVVNAYQLAVTISLSYWQAVCSSVSKPISPVLSSTTCCRRSIS